jgi:hypothetical protein
VVGFKVQIKNNSHAMKLNIDMEAMYDVFSSWAGDEN